jgi:hypothetical protein
MYVWWKGEVFLAPSLLYPPRLSSYSIDPTGDRGGWGVDWEKVG